MWASSDVSFGEHFSLECLHKILEPGWASRVGISAGSCQHFAATRNHLDSHYGVNKKVYRGDFDMLCFHTVVQSCASVRCR